jgi:hypothetical protein
MVTAGHSVCLAGGSCTRNVQDETPEFITFNQNSTITSLPNGGIRTTVPTPTQPHNTTIRITATAQTVTASLTGTIVMGTFSHLVTMTAQPDPSNKIPIIAGVTGGVGGLLLGAVLAAVVFAFRSRRKERQARYTWLNISEPIPNPRPSNAGSGRIQGLVVPLSPASGRGGVGNASMETASLQSREPSEGRPSNLAPDPEMRARWTGGTRYEALSPEDAATQDQAARRIATLDFRPSRPSR